MRKWGPTQVVSDFVRVSGYCCNVSAKRASASSEHETAGGVLLLLRGVWNPWLRLRNDFAKECAEKSWRNFDSAKIQRACTLWWRNFNNARSTSLEKGEEASFMYFVKLFKLRQNGLFVLVFVLCWRKVIFLDQERTKSKRACQQRWRC